MVALFDLDSLLYRAVHKCVSIGEIREQLTIRLKDNNRKLAKNIVREWIVENAYCKLEQMTFKILEDASNMGLETTDVELYVSYCIMSERKKIDPTYKAKRQRNYWVERLKQYISEKSNMDVKYSLRWEADDLIYNRAKALRSENKEYVVFAIDKDLRQVEGIHFNYDYKKVKTDYVGEIGLSDYKESWREIQKEYLVEQDKESAKLYKFFWEYKGIEVVEPKVAKEVLTYQMITGDNTDNIKGIPRLGALSANKLLENKSILEQLKTIILEYKKYYKSDYKKELKKNYRLLKIGN